MLVLTLFLALPGTTWYTVIGVPMGRCYTNVGLSFLRRHYYISNFIPTDSNGYFNVS